MLWIQRICNNGVKQKIHLEPVLMNLLILMRIRILDPHWKKINPDPGYFYKIYWIFLTFFSHIFILKLDNQSEMRKIFQSLFFSKVQILVARRKKVFFCSFWLIFYPLDPDPWICIFLRIRIQEAKILRILSTA